MQTDERRRAIIVALCKRKRETRENLAFEFGVTTRTIENDIVALSRSYPIYTMQGNGGGIFIDEDYRLDRLYLSEKQLDLLARLMLQANDKDKETLQSIVEMFGLKRRN